MGDLPNNALLTEARIKRDIRTRCSGRRNDVHPSLQMRWGSIMQLGKRLSCRNAYHDRKFESTSAAIEHGGAVVGMDWWGIGPTSMVAQLKSQSIDSTAIPVWDIRQRVDRTLLRMPGHLLMESVRSRPALSTLAVGWVIVTSPHRVSYRTLRRLKASSHKLVALLGDNPVGPREIDRGRLHLFDAISFADSAWAEHVQLPSARTRIVPWGSCISDDKLLAAESYRPAGFAVIGAPYDSRINAVRELQEMTKVEVFGDGWLGKVNCKVNASETIENTIRAVRRRRLAVLNIHHEQFVRGLNPQFFDYAAAAVPQIVLPHSYKDTSNLGSDIASLVGLLNMQMLRAPSELSTGRTQELASVVRGKFMFKNSVEDSLR